MADKKHTGAGHRERLRARFMKAGLEGFHDYESLELLLTYAIPRRDVKPLAKGLVNKFKGIKGVLDADRASLSETKGMGGNTAFLLSAVGEILKAYLKEKPLKKKVIRSPDDVMDFITLAMEGSNTETFFVMYLSSKNEVLGTEAIWEGPLKKDSVSPRKVIERAIAHNARSVIFVRTSPNSPARPAVNERELAKSLDGAASAIDIIIHDYVIKGRGSQFSAKESGWLGTK